MQVGDLVMTTKGNLAVLLDVKLGYETGQPEYVDLCFCGTGVTRTGFPAYKVKKVKADKKCP